MEAKSGTLHMESVDQATIISNVYQFLGRIYGLAPTSRGSSAI
jgi:hypothetical protein